MMNYFPKRHQGQYSQFEMLLTKGDTYNRDAKYQAQHGVSHGHLDTTKDNPKDIEE